MGSIQDPLRIGQRLGPTFDGKRLDEGSGGDQDWPKVLLAMNLRAYRGRSWQPSRLACEILREESKVMAAISANSELKGSARFSSASAPPPAPPGQGRLAAVDGKTAPGSGRRGKSRPWCGTP